jgi:hypothetical protein
VFLAFGLPPADCKTEFQQCSSHFLFKKIVIVIFVCVSGCINFLAMFRHVAVAVKVRNRLKQNAELAQERRANFQAGASAKDNVENWLKSQIGVQGSCKEFVEAHIAERCQNRKEADKRFRWDIFMFTTYSLFLLLYSFSACGTNMKGKLIARNLLQPEIGNFDDVQVIGKLFGSTSTRNFDKTNLYLPFSR